MPPERKKGSRKVINVASDDQEDSDLVPDDPSSNAESLDLFVDPLQGNPLVFYVHDDVEDKQNILKLIRVGDSIVYLVVRLAPLSDIWRWFLFVVHKCELHSRFADL